ncbi:MAG: hypothetical protein AAB592_05030 [Patescibacteria group bacterium]
MVVESPTAQQNIFAGKDLDAIYQETIDKQRAHLMALQEDFNGKCEAAKKVAEDKIALLSADDKAKKEEVLQEEKTVLEEALKILKSEVDRSTRETMKTLEAINNERERTILEDLERQIAAL